MIMTSSGLPQVFLALVLSSATASAWVDSQDGPAEASPASFNDTDVAAIARAYADGRDQEAVVLADRALRKATENSSLPLAEVHYWRGAALRRLNRHEEALVALDTAKELGASSAVVIFERALTLRALGREEEARQEYQEAEKLTQEDLARLEDLRRRWKESSDSTGRFQLRLLPTFGYDTNILSIAPEASLAEEADRASLYGAMQLFGRFRVVDEPTSALWLDLRSDNRLYAAESGLSFSDNLLSATWRSQLGRIEWLAYELRAAYGEAWLKEGGHFRTQRVAGPALLFHPAESWDLRLWGDYTDVDYYESIPVEQDRDGSIIRAGLEAMVKFASDWTAKPYLTWWNYRADGNDYDHYAVTFGGRVTTPEFGGLIFTPWAGITIARYAHPHSLSGFTQARSDTRFALGITVSLQFLEKMLGVAPSVSISFEKWSSNIDAFDFDRFGFAGSADLLALSF